MKKHIVRRILACIMLLCMLPVTAMAATEREGFDTYECTNDTRKDAETISAGEWYNCRLGFGSNVDWFRIPVCEILGTKEWKIMVSFDVDVARYGISVALYQGDNSSAVSVNTQITGSALTPTYVLDCGTLDKNSYYYLKVSGNSSSTPIFYTLIASYTDHTHSYSSSTHAPTCSSQGYTEYTCRTCGDSYKEDYVDRLPHTVVDDAQIPATCIETGKTAGTHCSVCNKTLSGRETIPMTEHTYVNDICSYCGYGTGKCGDNLTWVLDYDGKLTITGAEKMYDYSQGGTPWYGSRDNIVSVTLPDGITGIGAYAFEGITVSKIAIPESVCTIGNGAFYDCTGLTEVVIPEAVSTIGDYAFYGCTGLTKVTVPDAVTSIGRQGFSGCTNLTYLLIKGDAPSFGGGVFKGLTASIHYNSSMSGWDAVVTQGYGGSITWNSEHTYKTVVTKPTCTEKGYTTYTCACGNVKVDDYVDAAHKVTDGLCTVCGIAGICGDDLTWAFDEATGTLTISGTGSMYSYGTDKDERAPWSALDDKILCVILDEGVTNVGKYAFYYYPDTYPKLKKAILPSTLTSIDSYAFYYCRMLTGVELPAGLTSIGEYAFALTDLTECVIPQGVTRISYGAFSSTPLNKVVLPDGLTHIEAKAFQYCNKLESIAIPETVQSIGASAFAQSGLKEIETSARVGESAFESCKNLEKAVLYCPEISNSMFWSCDNLKEVVIAEGVTTISQAAFYGCTNLATVDIADSVTSIASQAFQDCTSLTEIIIPDSVTSLNDAFKGCSSLKRIYFEGAKCFNNSSTFKGVSGTVYYPADDSTWEWAIGKNWGGSIKWVAYDPCNEHTFGEFTETTAPGCTTAGIEVSSCTGCEMTKTRAIASTGHTWNDGTLTAPTCLEQGYTTFVCACGESYKDHYTDATGHIWDEGVVTTEPTEESTGIKKYTCTVCGETETETQPKLEHTHKYAASVTVPSCTNQGYTTFTCACGKSYKDNYSDATGHIWDDGIVTTEPTEESTGIITYTCIACDETETKTLPKPEHAHKYAASVTAPTCTEQGYTTYTCSACGNTYQDSFTNASGHTVVVIPAKEATCYESGLTEGTYCSVCEVVLKEQQDICALSHQFLNGSCRFCGLIRGDLNNDGVVDDSDVALLLWHTLFPENYEVSGDADFNGDGYIDDKDVAYLLWHTLFPDAYPL